jgi:hypothetical protein
VCVCAVYVLYLYGLGDVQEITFLFAATSVTYFWLLLLRLVPFPFCYGQS